jgi:hypothetical protein
VTVRLRLPFRVSSYKAGVSARRHGRPLGVGGTFRVVDLFATATMAAARCCQHARWLWIVGLLHAPSLFFQRRLLMALRNYEGLPTRTRFGVGSTNGPALVAFASPMETLSALCCPCLLRRIALVCRPLLHAFAWLGLLSWGCHRSPLHRHLHLVSTPGDSAAPESRCLARVRERSSCSAESLSVRSCHFPNSFRPCRSSRLRRFAPPGAFQVCCTLKPIMGFATFQALRAIR